MPQIVLPIGVVVAFPTRDVGEEIGQNLLSILIRQDICVLLLEPYKLLFVVNVEFFLGLVDLNSLHNIQNSNVVVEIFVGLERFTIVDPVPEKVVQHLGEVHDLPNVVRPCFDVQVALLLSCVETLDLTRLYGTHGHQKARVVTLRRLQQDGIVC